MNNDIKWTEKIHSNNGNGTHNDEKTPTPNCTSHKRYSIVCSAESSREGTRELYPRPLREREQSCTSLRVLGMRVRGKMFAKQTVKNLFSYSPIHLFTSKRVAFTLAEVLITLGIIGVVAAITMPTIMANVQKTILKNQFKSAYSKFSQAVMQTQSRMGYPVECSYWINGQYACEEKCNNRNEYGTCTSYSCADGSALSADHNGPISQCTEFYDELFNKTLKVVKYCEKNALANGCLTDAYRGQDKAKIEQNPEATPDPDHYFSDSNIKNKFASWVLSDGIVLIRYSSVPTFAIDINGHKGPNKWGYDIFEFKTLGDYNGIKKVGGRDFAEEGGTTTGTMIKEMFSK